MGCAAATIRAIGAGASALALAAAAIGAILKLQAYSGRIIGLHGHALTRYAFAFKAGHNGIFANRHILDRELAIGVGGRFKQRFGALPIAAGGVGGRRWLGIFGGLICGAITCIVPAAIRAIAARAAAGHWLEHAHFRA